jgi:hypothetical protein
VPQIDAQHQPSRSIRLLLTIIALGLITVFVIAFRLQPDERGFGTHQQLGLPPCTFREFTGVNCPHCGMTTCFANVVRGRFAAAWNANPAGIPLVALFACGIPWCLAVGTSGRWLGTQEPFFYFIVISLGYLTLALLVWGLRILL